MKWAFITRGLSSQNGYGNLTRSYFNSLIELLGEDNVFAVNLNSDSSLPMKKGELCFACKQSRINKLLQILSLNSPPVDNRMKRNIAEFISANSIQVVFVSDATYGSIEKEIKKKCKGVIIISLHHDIVRRMYISEIKKGSIQPSYIPTALVASYGEYLSAQYSNYHITLNNRDSSLFREIYGINSDFQIPICIEEPHIGLRDENSLFSNQEGKTVLLFVGAKYFANIHGVKWFIDEVSGKLNNCEIYIVGGVKDGLNIECIKSNIHIVGYVDDLEKYYISADIVIAPIFEGGGMKVKTAEAFAYGKALIGTSESLQGYSDFCDETVNRYIRVANNSEEFVYEINNYINGKYPKYHEPVREIYERYFSMRAMQTKIEELVKIVEMENLQ